MNKPVKNADLTARDILLREDNGAIATLTLNVPERRNSLSDAMLAALRDALAELAGDKSIRVVVIAANGPVFCAGHDLKEVTARRSDADRGRAYFEDLLARCAEVMQAVVRHPKPVIARVHAMATAAGCQLVASCDLAVAGENARFCTPGSSIGMFCSTPMVALSRNVAPKHAMEMLLTAEPIPAARAHEIGLVNRVVPDGDLEAETRALAEHIASKSGQAIKIGKEAFYRQLELGLTEAYAYASTVMTENMLARDAEEGIGAFLERRAPEWDNDAE
jgi:enoyl-CoA hydratase/carnithine racemase